MLFSKRSLWRMLLSLWAERAGRGAVAWLRGVVESAAKPALRRLLKMTITYLIAAGLAISAGVFLFGALLNGLVELGLPRWAAQLILGGAAAAVAVVLLKRAGDDEEEEDVEPPDLDIPLEKRPRPRRRSSSRDVYDVHPAGDRWELTSGSPRRKRRFDTKEEALAAARRSASKGRRARVVVHGANGAIQDVVDYRGE